MQIGKLLQVCMGCSELVSILIFDIGEIERVEIAKRRFAVLAEHGLNRADARLYSNRDSCRSLLKRGMWECGSRVNREIPGMCFSCGSVLRIGAGLFECEFPILRIKRSEIARLLNFAALDCGKCGIQHRGY